VERTEEEFTLALGGILLVEEIPRLGFEIRGKGRTPRCYDRKEAMFFAKKVSLPDKREGIIEV